MTNKISVYISEEFDDFYCVTKGEIELWRGWASDFEAVEKIIPQFDILCEFIKISEDEWNERFC